MVDFVKDEVGGAGPEDRNELRKIVLALSAEAGLPAQREADRSDAAAIEAGRKAMKESVFECTQCHAWRGEKPSLGGASRGPDLTGFGSRQWLIDFVRNPQHPRFYPGDKNDRMPLYGEQKILDERSIGLIVDWIRGDAEGPSRPAEPPVASAINPPPAIGATTTPAVAATQAVAPQTKPAELKPAATTPPKEGPEEPPFETEFETPRGSSK